MKLTPKKHRNRRENKKTRKGLDATRKEEHNDDSSTAAGGVDGERPCSRKHAERDKTHGDTPDHCDPRPFKAIVLQAQSKRASEVK